MTTPQNRRTAPPTSPPTDASSDRRANPPRVPQAASAHIEAYPHHDEAERSVLGALMLDARCAHEVAGILDVQDLYRESSRSIWRAIFALLERGAPLDVITIADELNAHGALAGVGGPAYIAGLLNDVPSAANVGYYGELVKGASVRRSMIAEADRARTLAFDLSAPVAESLQATQQRLSDVVRDSVRARGETVEGGLHGWHRGFMQRVGGLAPRGLSLGIPKLDAIFKGGIQPNRALVLAGYQKSGKTKAAVQLAAHLARTYGAAVEHYATEMTAGDLITRLISHEARVSEDLINDPLSVQDNATALARVVGDVERGRQLVGEYADRWRIYTTPNPKLAEIIATTRARAAELAGSRPLVLIVDYVQEIDSGAKPDQGDTKRLNAEKAAPLLVAMCNQHNVLGLFVAHLNRPDRKREGGPLQEPVADDIFASAAWAKAADHLMAVWAPFADEDPSDDPEERLRQQYARWIVGRSRHNAAGRVHLRADMARNRSEPWCGELPAEVRASMAR